MPEPGSGQVQIAIDAAAINPLDMVLASGHWRRSGIPAHARHGRSWHRHGVGDGVTEFGVGDRVFGQFWSQPLQSGTFAEVSVVQAVPAFGALATIPDELPSHLATALPISGMTALGALDHTQISEGGTLLVIGATGGVGTFAVQAAAARGIRVIATAYVELIEQVRALGAAEIAVRDVEPLDQALLSLAPEGVERSSMSSRRLHHEPSGTRRQGWRCTVLDCLRP